MRSTFAIGPSVDADLVRDRGFEREVHEGYARLVDAFMAVGFRRKEARLWVGAWRHTDKPAELARTALAFRGLGVEVGQAIPWFWEHIAPDLAIEYLPHRWRAAEARRVMQALSGRDPTLSRREALIVGSTWAGTGRSPAEVLRLVALGYDLDVAELLTDHIEREASARELANDEPPSTLAEWAGAGMRPAAVLRSLAAGLLQVRRALPGEHQFDEAPGAPAISVDDVLAALRRYQP